MIRKRIFPAIAAALAAATLFVPARGQLPDRGLVEATMVADVESIEPGVPFRLGIRFDMRADWHINWINPGDAGLAPSIDWHLPEGFTAEALRWPHPERFEAGPLVIFGYGGSVILWTSVTPGGDLEPGGRAELAADVDWLACQDACIPGQARTALVLPVAASHRPDTTTARLLEEAERRVPVTVSDWAVEATYDDDQVVVTISSVDPANSTVPEGLFFYPDVPGIIDNAGRQREETSGSGIALSIPRSPLVRATPERLTGVVVARRGWNGPFAIRIDVPLEPR